MINEVYEENQSNQTINARGLAEEFLGTEENMGNEDNMEEDFPNFTIE
jgi:hypothetical protein